MILWLPLITNKGWGDDYAVKCNYNCNTPFSSNKASYFSVGSYRNIIVLWTETVSFRLVNKWNKISTL